VGGRALIEIPRGSAALSRVRFTARRDDRWNRRGGYYVLTDIRTRRAARHLSPSRNFARLNSRPRPFLTIYLSRRDYELALRMIDRRGRIQRATRVLRGAQLPPPGKGGERG